MAEENKTVEEEWTEVDLTDSKDKKEKVAFEVDGEEDSSSPVEKGVLKTQDTDTEEETVSETEKEEELPELEGIETKGATKRIRQLVKQRKERDEALTAANQELLQLRQQVTAANQNKFASDGVIIEARESELNQKLESARTKFKEAYNSGNHDDLYAAQEELSGAQTEIKLLGQRKNWVAAQAQQYKQQVEQSPPPNEGGYDPLAQDWASRNPWFGQDRTATAVALALDSELKDRGYNPGSPEFYKEIDKRIKKELPGRFTLGSEDEEEEKTVSVEAKPSKPRQVVAGNSRSSASKKVKLTKADVALAKKWQIPLETYAAEKAKADKADGEYTAIAT